MSLNTTSQTQQAITALDTLVKQNGALIEESSSTAASLASMADSWAAMVTNRNRIDGYEFVEGFVVNTPGDIFLNRGSLVSIDDSRILSANSNLANLTTIKSVRLQNLQTISVQLFNGCSGLTTIELPELQSISTREVFRNCTSLKTLTLPKFSSIVTGTQALFLNCTNLEEVYFPELLQCTREWFVLCSKLKKVYMPKVTSFIDITSMFASCTDLIDLTLGAFTNSFSLATWSPTNALLDNSQTLLTEEDIAAGFTSNLEKLLYNIREHIAANLPTAPNTITFSAAVKSAINNEVGGATAAAFTNKGWTIA